MKDPYSVLGVSKTASQEEIKNAYRAIAKKNHPDLNPGNKEKEAKFKEAAQAYERIGTAEARAKFDRGETEEAFEGAGAGARGGPFYYQTGPGGGPGGGRYGFDFGGGGFDEDLFEQLFRGGGAGRGRARGGDAAGEDQLFQMEVDFRDSVLGAEREITLPGGKKLRVKIPAGVESGTRLRFRGQGGPGRGKGEPGDAYVEILVRPHPSFTRVGRDLETELPITFYDALAGAELEVPTIEGKVALRVPPGVSTGSRLRVKGRGVGPLQGARGDLFVRLKVVMPKSPPEGLRAAAAEWRAKFPYEPGGDT